MTKENSTPTKENVSPPKDLAPQIPVQQIVTDINNQTHVVGTKTPDNDLNTGSEQEKAKLDRFKNDTNLKSKLADFIIRFTYVWSVTVIILVYLVASTKFYLSDAVIITAITETMAIVLGLPIIVAWHFFPKS